MADYVITSLPLVLLAVTTCSYFLLDYFFGVKQVSREPPLIPSKVPWFGHLIGILGQKYQYFIKLRYFFWPLRGRKSGYNSGRCRKN
jgi:hypothetical protein